MHKVCSDFSRAICVFHPSVIRINSTRDITENVPLGLLSIWCTLIQFNHPLLSAEKCFYFINTKIFNLYQRERETRGYITRRVPPYRHRENYCGEIHTIRYISLRNTMKTQYDCFWVKRGSGGGLHYCTGMQWKNRLKRK